MRSQDGAGASSARFCSPVVFAYRPRYETAADCSHSRRPRYLIPCEV